MVTVASARVLRDWKKCARVVECFDAATADPAFPDITPRDAAAVREYRGLVRGSYGRNDGLAVA